MTNKKTNGTKQTAVERFIEKLEEKAIEETEGLNQIHIVIDVNEYLELKEQAKEMEKERIIKACDAGFDSSHLFIEDMKYKSAEDYYEQTYGGNK